MNKILNNKINSDLTRIIGLYVLSFSIPISFNTKNVMKELIMRTYEIKYSLKQNVCLDSNYEFNYDLKNTKIKHIYMDYNSYWAIRKC